MLSDVANSKPSFSYMRQRTTLNEYKVVYWLYKTSVGQPYYIFVEDVQASISLRSPQYVSRVMPKVERYMPREFRHRFNVYIQRSQEFYRWLIQTKVLYIYTETIYMSIQIYCSRIVVMENTSSSLSNLLNSAIRNGEPQNQISQQISQQQHHNV